MMVADNGKVKVLLVDDHLPLRDEIAKIIKRDESFEVIGVASNGRESIEKARSLHPDMIVMDVVMPEMNGIEAAKLILDKSPDIRILVLSNYTGKRLIQAAMDVGANGYVRKDHAAEDLIPALRTLAEGGEYIAE